MEREECVIVSMYIGDRRAISISTSPQENVFER